MARFRWIVRPLGAPVRRRGRWRPTRPDAIEAAVRAGLASRDEHVDGRVYFDALVEIEEDQA